MHVILGDFDRSQAHHSGTVKSKGAAQYQAVRSRTDSVAELMSTKPGSSLGERGGEGVGSGVVCSYFWISW